MKITESRRYTLGTTGSGQIIHSFHSETTHWAEEVASVRVEFWNFKPISIKLDYGCGGHRSTATGEEIARAMAEVFTRAADRLAELSVVYKTSNDGGAA